MINKYTSIELSRLIQSKVPEVETEDGWTNEGHGDKWYIVPRDQQYWDTYYSVSVEHNAYRLDDVLRAIQVWGEKKGWVEPFEVCHGCGMLIYKKIQRTAENKHYLCKSDILYFETKIHFYSERLLYAYLADDGFGERCERVIRSIFEV